MQPTERLGGREPQRGLAAENWQLLNCNRGLCRRLRNLEQEMGYLRAVLANQSALGHLLGCLARDRASSLGPCVRISTRLFQPTVAGAFRDNSDHDYTLPILAEEP
ncbi:CREB/ATF bZIP transcription factor, partial [Ophiophagus hannah]